MEFFHSWQDFFTFDRKEIARFFQDATAFMDGFHGSFAAEELYAAAAFIAAEADDLDEPHHARKRMVPQQVQVSPSLISTRRTMPRSLSFFLRRPYFPSSV